MGHAKVSPGCHGVGLARRDVGSTGEGAWRTHNGHAKVGCHLSNCRRYALGMLCLFGVTVGCQRTATTEALKPTTSQSAPSGESAEPASPAESAAMRLHLVQRLTSGPTRARLAEVERVGVDVWIEAALNPADENLLPPEAKPFADAQGSPSELVERFAKRKMDDGTDEKTPAQKRINAGELLGELGMLQLTRYIYGAASLHEVMVDFWINHFNVFARKGLVKLYASDYVERAIRPNALGRFEDLLLAVTQHPAMLVYLDNARSVKERSSLGVNDQRGKKRRKLQRGLNENLARELLELHTVGINAGYTQTDVYEVARVLTGWTIEPASQGRFGFRFVARHHDQEAKVVMGTRFEAGGGFEEGVRLLRFLASHPATAEHLAAKLCTRFVSDDTPKSCVRQVSESYLASRGDLKAVLRTLVTSDVFWARQNRQAKLKTPLEFVSTALLALDAKPANSKRLLRALARLGQPMFLYPPPTGYPETSDAWTSSGAVLIRSDLAWRMASQRLPGATFPKVEGGSVQQVVDSILLGRSNSSLAELIGQQTEGLSEARARVMAAALTLSSPEFQLQ